MKYYEVDFTLSPINEAASDILAALLGEVGFETFSPSETGLYAYIQQKDWNEEAVQNVISSFPLPDLSITYSVSEVPDLDWNVTWEESFSPIRIGDLVCIHDTRFPAEEGVKYDIHITPRLAFGTGSHQTTRMLLQILCDMPLEGCSIVDAGTGTGILAILCLIRKASDVLAYDIDEWSVSNAAENSILNGVEERMFIYEGDASVLQDVTGKDLVIANINRNILLADMPAFVRTLKSDGRLLLSGFYSEDIPYLVEKGKELGLTLRQEWHDEEWAAILLETDASRRMNL